MMKKAIKKISCFLLAVLIFAEVFPQKAFASVDISKQEIDFPSVYYFGVQSVPDPVTPEKVSEKIEKIRQLKGKYFTVSKTYCNNIPGETVHGCDNCESTNLIKTDLYDLMPESRNCLPEYHRNTGGISKLCWSCAAFASITHWYIYAEKSTDVINVNKISSGVFNAETLASAKPGDIIALSYASSERHFHSMIFLGHTANGISVIDCNWSTQTYGNCMVLERNVSYSDKYTVAVSRAANYYEGEVSVEGVEITDSGNKPVPEKIVISVGEKIKLNAAVKPQNASNKTVFWSSDDDSVASVSEEGEVTGKSFGTAEIKVKTENGNFTDSVLVEVSEKNYTVEFIPEEGVTGIPETIISEGTKIILPKEVPIRENWIFLHWSDGKNIYKPGESYEIFSDKILSAVWFPAWFPEMEVKDIFAKPGETAAVPVYISGALEPENTEIEFTLRCEGLRLTRSEFEMEIPENGIIATFYFKIPESAAEGEYPIEILLESCLVSGKYDLTENVTLVQGSIFVGEYRFGDVDGNGKINILDANLVRRYTAKLTELDVEQKKAADVDGNGKINILDANLIRRYTAKLIDSFPVG